MRIAIFCETYLPYINGVVTHIKSLKDGLEKEGHRVLIVTADPKAKHHTLKDGVLRCPAQTMKKLYGYGLSFPYSRMRMKYIEEFDPDVCHIHQEFGVGLFGAIVSKQLKKPLVYTLHTMYDDYLYYVAPRPFVPMVREFSHFYFRKLAQHATALTGPSDKVSEYLEKCGVYKKVHVIPNPVELTLFNPSNIKAEDVAAVRKSLGLTPDITVACFCGRLGKEKNIDLLLGYFAETIRPEDKIHLMILGDGPGREEFIEETKRLGIADMVTFVGKVEHDRLPPYYGASKFYVTASLSDTNSISMKEGMASGLPVLHLYDKLNENQVTDGVNGYFYHTKEEMAERMRYLRDLAPEAYAALQASTIESMSRFSVTALANNLLAVYDEAIETYREKKRYYAK